MSEVINLGVEADYSKFVRILLSGQDRYIPYRNIRSTSTTPRWMTNRLKHLIGVKRGIYKRMKNGELELRERYNTMARTVRKEIRKAKRDYELRVATNVKNNPKGFFSFTKLRLGKELVPLK